VFPKAAIFVSGLAGLMGWAGILVGCADRQPRRVVPSYDQFTGRLVQIGADQNGDGRLDQWTFLDGNAILRGESDADGDGRIDRWEYFDAASALESVGTSSLGDGVEDTWTLIAPTPEGEVRIARSRKRDRQRDRYEYFRGAVMVRAEEDTNGDGRPDRWDRYEGVVLREAAFDTTLRQGRPDRRLVYDAEGRFTAVEVDPEGDGTFARVPGKPPIPRGTER
jgi:hypothetical protein